MALDLLVIARALIATDSRSSVSDRPLVDLLLPLCREAGLQTSLQEEPRDDVPQFNLIATRPGGTDARPLLLDSHLDTVPPGDHASWSACDRMPYRLTEHDGRLFGLGTADVKLDFLCKLLALERLRHERLERGVVLAGTYGEETGRWGARLLTAALRPLPSMALVGEPTLLRPCTAHKGYTEIRLRASAQPQPSTGARSWRLVFHGQAAHSSQPHVGRSANDACLAALGALAADPGIQVLSITGGDLVNRVSTSAEAILAADERPTCPAAASVEVADRPAARFCSPALTTLLLSAHASTAALRDELKRYTIEGFDPPWSSANNGLVRLDGATLSHVVDVRRVPGSGPPAAVAAHLKRLRTATASCGCEARVVTELDSPPFRAAPGSRVTAALERALAARGRDTSHELKSGTTEASVYSAVGMDTVVFGPGQANGNIHRPNESVPLADLRAAVDTYVDVIRMLCAGSAAAGPTSRAGGPCA